MKSRTVASLLFMLFSAAAISAIETDYDRDGIPDSLDRRPHVASYYHHGGLVRQNPVDQPIGQDTDNEGIPDRLDARPWVASYYHHHIALRFYNLHPCVFLLLPFVQQ